MRFAIIASRFNSEIVDRLVAGAMQALHEHDVTIHHVPGAFEIPLAAKRAALTKKYDAIVAIGCVMRGETPHFDYISQQVSMGIGQVALETGVPVTFGVLTVNTEEQAMARSELNADNKGFEAARAAIEMVNLLNEL
jgi:6,7-dimethyl-8-ribityllumazine synthase